jgi:hypothetical protein
VYELFQTLPRVTRERDVVAVEHQSETSCHNRLDSLYLTEFLAKSNAARISALSKSS